MMNRWSALVLASLVCVSFVSADEPVAEPGKDAEPDKIGKELIAVVIGNEPIEGYPVLPATDTTFRLKLRETGDVMEFRWTQLEEGERKRVQKLYKLEVVDDRRRMGNKITGHRYYFENGKMLEGLLIPERSRKGQKAIRTANIPFMLIDEREIKNTEEIECYESDFFSPREIYERMILEKPPSKDDAASHLEYARTCGNMGLYKEALEHLKIAEIIDPRTIERNADDRQALINEHAHQEGLKLYQQLLWYRRASEFFSALDVMDKLDRNFPNHSYRSRWDSIRQEIIDGSNAELEKKVIQSSYGIALDLIQQKYYKKIKLDEKGNVVASIPGKQVTTRQGDIFRGTIIEPDNNGYMVLKVGEMNLRVRIKDIMSVQDVDLSIGAKEVAPLFDDLKQYVYDTGGPTGLKAQMIARISQLTKKPEAKVREIFDQRLYREATYADGKLDRAPVYVTNQTADYGRGSWLRDGSKPLPPPQFVNQGRQDPNAPRLEDTNPDVTDDPAVWWKFQDSSTHLAILRAFAAEKVFTPIADRGVQNIACKNCGTKRTIQIMGAGGKMVDIRCPDCRGLGVFFRVIYH